MEKIFGEIEMTWKRVIIFAIVAGVYTGLINNVPFLYDTSLTDLAVNFERWILFALFIMMNCKNPLDAAKKTFVFFVISQPLVYLVEVPFLGWSVMHYYKNWIEWTLLTIPMAFIGTYCIKKKNFLSLLIMIPALILFAYSYEGYFNEALFNHMHHLYSAIFCVVVPFILMYVMFDKKLYKIIAYIIYLVMLILFTISLFQSRRVYNTTIRCSSDDFYFDENYKVELKNEKIGELKIELVEFDVDDKAYCLNGYFKTTGKSEVVITDAEGKRKKYDLVVRSHSYDLLEQDNRE